MNITDSNEIKGYESLDVFYSDPLTSQNKCRDIFKDIFDSNIDFYSFKGLFLTTLNRYFLTDIKILEHYFIVENIILACNNNNNENVNFKFHRSNINLYKYYSKVLNSNNINTSIEFHDNEMYWKNTLTNETFIVRFVNVLKRYIILTSQFLLLFLNYIIKSFIKKTTGNILFWHSFANNRTKIDYPFLNTLLERGENYEVIHADPYSLKPKQKWARSIYFMNDYTITPLEFLRLAKEFINVKNNLNLLLNSSFRKHLKHNPTYWNTVTLNKFTFFMVYNLLVGGMIERYTKNYKNGKIVNVFRGGAAAGLIYAGLSKIRYSNTDIHNILVPHGTEFNPLDHFAYFFLDFNILPSEKIKDNWESILTSEYSSILKYNKCQLLAGGRIDYSLLDENVVYNSNLTDKKIIGIVLTYNPQSFQDSYIESIVNSFEKQFKNEEFTFIIKPRPNDPYFPNDFIKTKKNVIISKEDIFDFLNKVHLIVGTVSSYGILTMVVTDGIYKNIPGIYFLNSNRYNPENLGYSYHKSMESYTFQNFTNLEEYISSKHSFVEMLNSVQNNNLKTLPYLEFHKDPNSYLREVIEKFL